MFVAGIAVVPLGPTQHLAYTDARVRVDIAYRMTMPREDPRDETGGNEPHIAMGSVTYVLGGVRHVIDLADTFPIRRHRIIVSADGSCGTGRPIARRGSYLSIEAVLSEKGCAALVALIDLDRGTVLERVALDHPSAHRFDALPERLVGESMRVEDAQLLNVPATTLQSPPLAHAVPWWVVAVRAVDARGRVRELAYCAADFFSAADDAVPTATVPRAGSRIVVGTLQGHIFIRPTMFEDERVVRLSRDDEARFEAHETPVPADLARVARRNAWFYVASEATEAEDFDAAVAAMEHMLAIDATGPGVDPSTDMDRDELARCRVIAGRVRAGTLVKEQARALFRDACRPLPAPSGSPAP